MDKNAKRFLIVMGVLISLWTIGKLNLFESDYQVVTMDGTNIDTGELDVWEINLWKDYKNRSKGISATVSHDESVKMIERSGDGVLIETSSGKRGWVTYYFIRELRK